ncbi:MAG: DUF2764 family protein [Victivallales bacterium]|nr:DUF2764 family protein [Victivallales bacterium]
MPNAFYYFLCSLPSLHYGKVPKRTHEAFLAECSQHVSPEQFALLSSLSLNPADLPERNLPSVLVAWKDWETDLRNAMAEVRARRMHLSQTGSNWQRPTSDIYPTDRKRAEDILGAMTGREQDEALDNLRWQKLEELGSSHHFDFASLLVYTLKSLLLEKARATQVEAGDKFFSELSEAAEKQALTSLEKVVSC